jgi:hypothetical protein
MKESKEFDETCPKDTPPSSLIPYPASLPALGKGVLGLANSTSSQLDSCNLSALLIYTLPCREPKQDDLARWEGCFPLEYDTVVPAGFALQGSPAIWRAGAGALPSL